MSVRKARNRFERSKQVLGWLQSEWPAGRRIEMIWVHEIIDEDASCHCHGQTYREDRHIVIELSMRKCRTWEQMNSTLIHEYVHAVQWGLASIEHHTEHHPPTFYTLMGEIQNRWDHDHGYEQASEFPLD
jgi:hypothetical protein|tara:strand:- start:392 stop:781 length:390 start_codon:yes stop_codon:yes gene_type:complete